MGHTWAEVIEELALVIKDGFTNGARKLIRHDTSPFQSQQGHRIYHGAMRVRGGGGTRRFTHGGATDPTALPDTIEKPGGSTPGFSIVDLLGRYSNLRELQEELEALYQEMEKQPRVKRKTPVATHIHKIEMRLGMETIQQIVADYRAGYTSTQLMGEYGIGKTSMLRLLHEAGAITPGRRNHRKSI